MTDDPGQRGGLRLQGRLASGGIILSPEPLTQIGRGFDNTVLLARTSDGIPVVIKSRRGTRPARYATARWAGEQMRRAGAPTPRILWHDDDFCVETFLAGRPLCAAGRDALSVARSTGAVLRAVHTIVVDGFGQLDPTGQGPDPTLATWLTGRRPEDELRDVDGAGPLSRRVGAALRELAPIVPTAQPRLLHGDWVARHVLSAARKTTGVVDLESARGGDPAADLAGWSLQEPAELTRALFEGYRLDRGDRELLLRLVLHRLRIGPSLARHHHRNGDTNRTRLHLTQLRVDVDDLDSGWLRAVPSCLTDLLARTSPDDRSNAWGSSTPDNGNASARTTVRKHVGHPPPACS